MAPPPAPSGNSQPPARRRPGPAFPTGWVWLLLLALLAVVLFWHLNDGGASINYSDFMNLVDADIKRAEDIQKKVEADKEIPAAEKDAKAHEKIKEQRILKKVTFVGSEGLRGELEKLDAVPEEMRDRFQGHTRFTMQWQVKQEDSELLKKLNELRPLTGLTIGHEEEFLSWLGPVLLFVLPVVLLFAFFFFFILPRFRDPLGGGFINNYIKSPARRYDRTKQRVTFDDVANMESAKGELQEIVEFLRTPDKFQRLGAQVPKGVLLVGPPGTGKTLLAKAVAGEANVPFYSINGAEFIQLFVGVGASRVRDLFKTAKENAPCLVFIDEIDAVGRMRGAGVGGGSDEREQTLNQILGEMDGFTPNDLVIVLAATNRPDVLDPALLRPGRFDRHVTIDRPNWQGRMAILKVHTRNKPLGDDVNLETIARKMIGMTGADLRNLCNEAALLATREGKNKIDRNDFERAADRVLIGPKREEVLTADDKRRIAYHEAGHALVSWLVPGADRPLKVSIIPRGRTLGVNISVPEEERYHHGLDYFKGKLIGMMGGRAADRLVYGQPEAGAEMDIKQATRLARLMVTRWGMSDRLGPVNYRVAEEHVFLGKEIQEARDFSEGTAQIIDEEVRKLIVDADGQAYDLLKTNRGVLDKLVEALLQREELHREEIEELLRGEGFDRAEQPNGRPAEVAAKS